VPVPAVIVAAAKARTVARTARAHSRSLRLVVATAAVGALTFAVLMTGTIIAIAGSSPPATTPRGAVADIPPDALAAYRAAAQRWQMDWAVLAGIGKLECNHGRSELPGCNPPGTINAAGARGYMQFIGSTWRRGLGQHQLEPRTSPPAPDGQGYATDGDGDGDADPWSWPDATNSAARYLTANGVTQRPEAAIWRYNHDHGYVTRVLDLAATYRAAASAGDTGEAVTGNGALTAVACPAGGSTTVDATLAPAVTAMYQAADRVGVHLCGGGYRDHQRQIELRRAHCGTSAYAVYQMPPSQCSPPTARPGTSMHEQGLAIDLTCDGQLITSRNNVCYHWLTDRAASYGLHELASGEEPWHYSTTGR
jgi:hypothetical protein